MPVFIELTTFDFEKTFREKVKAAQGSDTNNSSLAGKSSARRPVRGVEIKNNTYAYLKVVAADGTDIPIFDSSDASGMSTDNSNFLLQSVQEGRAEKNQIVETFGDAYIFFFGENPRMVQVQGVLLNSADFQWRTEWWANYNTYLRGTKLAEMGARVYLFYDDVVLEGYIMEAQAQEAADMPQQVRFSFRMFISNYSSVNQPGNPHYPIRASVQLPPNVTLTEAYAAETLMAKLKGDAFWAESGETAKQLLDNSGRLLQSAPDGRPRPFAEWKKVSDALRASTSSVGFSPDVWKAINTLPEVERNKMTTMMFRNGEALRGLIAANEDEYVGKRGKSYKDVPAQTMFSPSTLNAQEADDLFQYAISALGCYGADVNNPSAMNSMGWGPGAPATYGAQASWSPSQGWQTSTVGPGSNNDPLNSVYGTQTSYDAVSSDRSKYYEGSGDYAYGYASAYGGVGYGQAGFGDYGGVGFGAGIGTGDPGYRDPDKFTAAGVSDNRDAYNRFIAKKNDDTALTGGGIGVSLGVSVGVSVSVGASMSYNEAPTAFSLTSVEGTLDASFSFSLGTGSSGSRCGSSEGYGVGYSYQNSWSL